MNEGVLLRLFNEVNKVATSGMPRSIMTKELKKIFKANYVSGSPREINGSFSFFFRFYTMFFCLCAFLQPAYALF